MVPDLFLYTRPCAVCDHKMTGNSKPDDDMMGGTSENGQ